MPPPALAARDAAMRQAYALSGMTVAQLVAEMAAYAAGAWLRERAATECPVNHRGRIQEWLWRALKAWPHIVGAEQLAAILAALAGPLTGAERSRLWRARRRAEMAVTTIAYREAEVIDALINVGRLPEAHAGDARAVAAALADVIHEFLGVA